MRKLLACFAAFAVSASALAQAPRQGALDSQVRQGLALTAYTIQHLDLPATPQEAFTIHLNLGGKPVDLDLSRHSVRAEGFKVLVQDATGLLHEVPAPPVNTYRGALQQNPASSAAASLNAGTLSAMITVGEGAARQTWFVQPLRDAVPGAPLASHVVYREQDRSVLEGTCGMVEDDHRPRPALPGTGSPDAIRVCQIACEADFEFYTLLGQNQTNVTNDINTVINAVSNIYEVDASVEFQVTQIIIRTSAATNPYTTSNAQTFLGQMASHWASQQGSVIRDIAHLFTGRDLSGSTIGIAYLSGVCSFQIGYGLVQSRFTTNFAYRVGLSAHELGHNFSAQHCDGVCNPCYIMCSGLGGCNGVISTFEPCTKTVITNYANSRPCLTVPPPPVLPLPFTEAFPTSILDPLKWANNNGAGVSPTAANPPSPPNALLFIQAASVETKEMNTAAPGRPIYVAFRSEHSGVEAGKRLDLEYFNEFANAFQPLGSVTSDGVTQSRFVYQEFELPLTGLSNTKGKLRFKGAGTEFDDAWYVDDVSVSIYCRADVNKDGSLNLADFGAFQTAFASGNFLVADYNDDGLLNLADFGAFQTAFALGCY